MPFQPHYRITLSGWLFQPGTERFTFGCSAGRGSSQGPVAVLPDDNFDNVVAVAKTYWNDARNLVSDRAALDQVKVARIGADGKYLGEPQVANFPFIYGPTGGTPSQYVLAQSSLCISTVTERYGATGKGRYFTPMPAVTIQVATGTMAAADAQNAAAVGAEWLSDVNGALVGAGGGGSADPVVVVASTKNYLSEITGVRAGRVVDTMRSRRRSLAEDYGAVEPLT